MTLLRYGKTNTYFFGGLLIDTDMPGTIDGLFRELKKNKIELKDIRYVTATHYHPDHVGLIGKLMSYGVKLLLVDKQVNHVHFSDRIFERENNTGFVRIKEENAVIISCEESRSFLKNFGISGEIISTESHSADGIAVVADDGSCFVGDLEPISFIDAYENNTLLENDWKSILKHKPKKIYFGHCNSIDL